MNPFKNLSKTATVEEVFYAITVAIEASGVAIHTEVDLTGPCPAIKILGGEVGVLLVHAAGMYRGPRWEVSVRQNPSPLKTLWVEQERILQREITQPRLPTTLNFIMGGIIHHMTSEGADNASHKD